jgi:hypothetical protein
MMTLTVEYLRECFDMDEATGVLTWRSRARSHFKNTARADSWNAIYAGKKAGGVDKDGYVQCKVYYQTISAQRICWALAYGEFPTMILDHIDRNRANNAISNLRECTKAENSRNVRKKANAVGLKGVRRSRRKFQAQIGVNNKKIYLGSFSTAAEAHAAYCVAAVKHHGEFANLGTTPTEGATS